MKFDRRTFLRMTAGAAGLRVIAPFRSFAAQPISGTDRERLGVTTVCLKDWFPQTRKGASPGPELTLEKIPAFFVKEFDVRNIEIWSRHFSDTSLDYCSKLAGIASQHGCRIRNIQLDGKDDVSAPDKGKRVKSIEDVKAWMDRAAACGAGSLRANVGGRADAFDVETSVGSFRQLAAYGEKIGVKILVENHTGASVHPANVLAIVRGVDSPWCRTLPDFGNISGKATEPKRLAVLSQLLPDAGLISAKGTQPDAKGEGAGTDLGACVRLAEKSGYGGIYSAEYWPKGPQSLTDLEATRRILQIVADNLAG